MKQILFVLDSCRWDNFEPDTPYRMSYSNVTFPTACVYFGLGPGVDYGYNNIRKRSKGIQRAFVDNAWLSPTMWPWKESKKYFTSYEYFDKELCNTDEILEVALRTIQEDKEGYYIIWLMDTHSPYFVDGKPFEKFYDLFPLLKKYNFGEDAVTDEEMNMLKERQQDSLICISKKIANFIHELDNFKFTITADHGESFGENHKFGHGTDVHPVQFTIPFITGEKNNE